MNVTTVDMDSAPELILSPRQPMNTPHRIFVSVRLQVQAQRELWCQLYVVLQDACSPATIAQGSTWTLLHTHDQPVAHILSAPYGHVVSHQVESSYALRPSSLGQLVEQFVVETTETGDLRLRVLMNPVRIKSRVSADRLAPAQSIREWAQGMTSHRRLMAAAWFTPEYGVST